MVFLNGCCRLRERIYPKPGASRFSVKHHRIVPMPLRQTTTFIRQHSAYFLTMCAFIRQLFAIIPTMHAEFSVIYEGVSGRMATSPTHQLKAICFSKLLQVVQVI